MKILVTGADGFIGKNLCYFLERELNIIPYGLDLPDFYNKSDWASELLSIVNEINPNVIFHIGACSDTLETGVNYMMELNYESTKILTDWARDHNGKIIYSSSAASYGINNKFPSNLYGWSKYVAEGYVTSNGGVALRYFNVYGPGENHKGRMSSVALQMLDKKKNGEDILLFPGDPKRDFVYVDDVVSAYLKLAEVSQLQNLNGEAFNFSRDEPLSVLDLYREISMIVAGKYIEPEIKNTTKSEIKDQHLNSAKAHAILGWKSSIDLQNGLNKTFNWYKNYLVGK